MAVRGKVLPRNTRAEYTGHLLQDQWPDRPTDATARAGRQATRFATASVRGV